MGDFMELRVWQKAKDLAVYIYRITDKGLISKDYGLKDQIRRAAVSIPSNIAEGEEAGTNRMGIRYFFIAKGSLAEVQTQTIIAYESGLIDRENYEYVTSECQTISKMLRKLIQARSTGILHEPLPDYPTT